MECGDCIYIYFLCGIMAFGEMACLPTWAVCRGFPLWDLLEVFTLIFIFSFYFLFFFPWYSGCNLRRRGIVDRR